MVRARKQCAYCEIQIIGRPEHMIHRDGFGEGPEVPLCAEHGSKPVPTCEQVWERIAARGR